MGLDVLVVELLRAPPGFGGAGVAQGSERSADRTPGVGLLWGRLGDRAQMRQGRGRIVRQQLGQRRVGLQLGGRDLQNPAPGLGRLLGKAHLGEEPRQPPRGGSVAPGAGQDVQVLQRPGPQALC